MVYDRQGRCLSINDVGRRLMQCGAGEMVGRDFSDLWPPEAHGVVDAAIREVLAGRPAAFEAQRLTGPSVRWWSMALGPIVSPSGEVDRFIAIGSDISERREAEERVHKHLEHLDALCRVSMAISANLDLDLTLNTLLEQVTSRLRVDAASVLLLNPHSMMLGYAAGRGFRTDRIRQVSMRLGQGYAGRAIQARQRVVIPDFSRVEELAQPPGGVRTELPRSPLVQEEGFRSYVAVPLVAKGKVKGVLEVFHRTPFTPDEEWTGFMDALAGQAAVALDSATLFAELEKSRDELVSAYDTTIEGWARALDYRDKETEGHSRRVTEMTERLAAAMGIGGEDLIHIRRGALLHDIGKLGVPDGILLKAGPLTPEEMAVMKRHATIAYEILSPIPFLRQALDIPYCHHERWDGTGYPRGLKGDQIPLGARIFAVVDVWDALQSDRPYRPAWPPEKVRAHLRAGAESHFDPAVVDAFLKSLP
jgi:PAS domain S-box-containing protein/putative nucleotidyltransferase with HDIG domain